MQPNLLVGDYIIVSKYAYGYSRWSFPFGLKLFEGRVNHKEPKRGDIIVFRPPKVINGKDVYIKRLMALPGDKVQMINGQVYINNKILETEEDGKFTDDQTFVETAQQSEDMNGIKYTTLDTDAFGQLDNTKLYTVPQDHYFMLGDNRDNSSDSRVFGFVPKENLIGRAEIIMLSFDGLFLKFWDWRFSRFFKSLRN